MKALAARGAASLWDSVELAIDRIEAGDPAAVKTVIVLANGLDDGSSISPGALEGRLRGLVAQGRPVQILVVSYGSNVRALTLLQESLEEPSLGRCYKDDVSDIAQVRRFMCAYQ